MKQEFSPETVSLLGEALEIAWDFVRGSSEARVDEQWAREMLAHKIITAAQAGIAHRLCWRTSPFASLKRASHSTGHKSRNQLRLSPRRHTCSRCIAERLPSAIFRRRTIPSLYVWLLLIFRTASRMR